MAKYTGWEDWFNSVTTPSPGEPARKKKKKPFVGPTRAAAQTVQLATASEGRPNTSGPAPMPGVPQGSRFAQAPAPGKAPLIPQTLLDLALTPIGGLLAQENIAVTPRVKAPAQSTMLEQQIRAISLAYFQHTGVLPSPHMVTSLLSTQATANLTTEQYVALLRRVKKLPEPTDYSNVKVGFFQNQEVPLPNQLGAARGTTLPTTEGMYRPNGNLPMETMQKDMDTLMSAGKAKKETSSDLASLSDKRQQMLSFSDTLATRLRARGAPVEWDVENPWQDQDFLRNAAIYAIGRQFAYSIWGKGKDQTEANKTIAYLRTLPFSNDSWNEIGKKLGIGMADWSNQQTIGAVFDAIRSSDNDLSHKVIYDAWTFGRPVGESPSQSRVDYAEKFGAERLPAPERLAYEQSNATINGILMNAMGVPGELWKKTEKVPWLGRLTAPIGWAVGQTMKWGFAYPTEEIMRSFASVMDLSVQADPDVFDKGYTQQEYVAAMRRGETEKSSSWYQVWNYHWGVFIDASRLNAAWEDNAGRNPFTDAAEQISVEQTGYIAPWAKDVGDLANFTAMFWLGAKMDPMVRGGAGLVGKGAFKAGRYIEPTIAEALASTKARYATSGQSGEWVIREPHVNEAGVKVAEIVDTRSGKTFTADADVADIVAQFNEGGMPTFGSHGKSGHPAGHPAAGESPYVEFNIADLTKKSLDPDATLKDFQHYAKDAGLEFTKNADTVVVKGNLEGLQAFADKMSPKESPSVINPTDTTGMSPITAERVRALEAEHGDINGRLEDDASAWTDKQADADARTGTNVDRPGTSDAELLAHIKQVASDRGGLARDNHWDSKNPKDSNAKFLGLARVKPNAHVAKGTKLASLEMIADELQRQGIDVDAGHLWDVMQREVARRGGGRVPKAKGSSPAQAAKDIARLEAIKHEIKVILAKENAKPDEGLLSAPDKMFATDEFIGEGQQAGLDIAVDQNAVKGKYEAHPQRPQEMPGQIGMETAAGEGYAVGDKVRVAQTAEFGAGIGKEITGTITEIERLPDGTLEYKVEGATQPWMKAESILGPERRSVPRETAAAPVERTGTGPSNQYQPDLAEPVAPFGMTKNEGAGVVGKTRIEDAGFPVHRAEPNAVEFILRDLGEPGTKTFRQRLAQLNDAAKKTGSRLIPVKRDIAGFSRSAIRIETDDPAGFTNALVRNAEPPAAGVPGGPSTPTPPVGSVPSEGLFSGDPRVPMQNAIFRINSEVIANVDSPAYLRFLYQIPEDNPALLAITDQLAKAKTVEEVTPLLRKLQDHGVEIDGGASAFYKNMRQSAYLKGFGRTNYMRFFITPTTYGKTHSIEGSTDMMFNVMVATKFGMKKLSPEGWARVRELRDRLGNEASGLKKRNIVDEIWTEIEANIIKERGSLDGLNKYEHVYHKAQGKAIISGNRRAYFGTWKDGRPVEGSRVVTSDKARSHVQAALTDAKAQLDDILSGAPEKTRAKAEVAVRDAEKEALKVEKAIAEVDRLTAKETLTKAEVTALNKAGAVLDNYGTVVPMKMGQKASHIVHRRNPRIVASYMTGNVGMAGALVDQAVFAPLMTLFKETVMSALGFPVRVNIGDEYVRLIPEGTIKRMRKAGEAKSEAKAEGFWGDELDNEIRDKLAYDWVASDSGDWILSTKDTHPRYYEYLAQDLRSWASEPIVKRLIEMNKGEFPTDLPDIHWFISQLSKENSKVGGEMRAFLEDTYRSAGGNIHDAAFAEWTAMWEDRLTAISGNETLRRSMTHTVDAAELKQKVPDELLWPVNAPEALHVGSIGSPLTMLPRLNPFHYIYQGIPVPEAIWGGGHRVGSLQLLGVMSNWLRETMFSDRYYQERKAMLDLRPELSKTPEGRFELHQNAADKALKYTNKTTYSRSSTMFEDMTRNLIPFGNAYRQFWQYWTANFAKHPVSTSVFLKGYGEAQQNLGDIAGEASQEAGGPDITMSGQFLGIGDYQAYLPAVPFLAVQDQDAPGGPLGILKSNVPQAGFLVTGGARTLAGAMNIDVKDYQNYPGMGGLGNMSPFSRQAKLLYGITGWTMGGNSTIEGLFGDPQTLEKAHANAIVAQLSYDENGTGDGTVDRSKPWWWKATESMFGAFGLHDVKPEALFAEAWKTFVPSPASASYSPQATRDKGNWLFTYYDKQRTGDTKGAASLRAEHSWLDRYLSYYDASSQEQIDMKRDPENADLLKFWVSPYNYAKDGGPLDGRDWQTQFTEGRVSYKTEQQYITAIHNLYTDIHGGTYLQSDTRTAGTQYAGDNPRATAEKRTKAKLTHALTWAKKMSAYAAKSRGWDPEVLMTQFQTPGKNWGIWPEIMRLNGLDPAEYNVETIGKVFADKYGADYKLKPQYLSSTDALRALDMAKWIPDPGLSKRLLTETPFVDNIRAAKKDQKTAITKAVIESAGLEQWYWLGSQQLRTIGIKASPKIDTIQLDLNSDYRAMRKLTVGTDEYKAARTAYYAKRDKLLGGVLGGELISGGVADRLAALPFVLTPQVTLMGTGRGAVAKQTGYDNFALVTKKELAKVDPNPEHLNLAWDKLVGFRKYAPRQQEELTRVAAWSYLIAEAKHRRYVMRTHYSEYYGAPGESSASKFGSQQVDELNKVTKELRKFSPRFSREVDDWFGTNANIGTRFLNWYIY